MPTPIGPKKRRGRKNGSPAVRAVADWNEQNGEFPPLPWESWDFSGCIEKTTENNLYGRGGATTVVTPKGVEIVRKLRASHCNKRLIAHLIGTNTSTLNHAARRQPELAEALESGAGESEAFMVTQLIRAANAGFAPALIFLLKAMHGYRENDAPQMNVSNVTFQLPRSLTMEQMKEMSEAGITVNQLPPPVDELEGTAVPYEPPPE